MATNKSFEDLNLSQDEIERFTKALQDEKFRKMLVEYAEEISNPENKARYEAEIAQLENERGMDVKFVHPQAGYVVKTAHGDQKVFVNVCKNEHIGKPSSKRDVGPDGKSGLVWSIPHSFAPPRDEKDKKGGPCKVIDFVVHPDTYRMAETNARFKNMLHDTAFDGIARQFEMDVDRKNLKFPKIKFMGTATPTVIRTRQENADGSNDEKSSDDVMSQFPYPYGNETTEEMMKRKEEEIEKRVAEKKVNEAKTTVKKEIVENEEYAVPKYTIKHRSNFDMQDFSNSHMNAPAKFLPDELVVEISLPLLKSAAPIDLDIFERKLTLKSEKPAKYCLELDLPHQVDENEGSASFDKSKHHLTVKLPVVRPKATAIPDLFERPSLDDSESPEEFTSLKDQTQPLIEVLGSHDSGVDVNEVQDEVVLAPPPPKPELKRMLPDYDLSQNDETVSFVIQVQNIVRDSVEKTFLGSSPCGIDLKFHSVGSGGVPMGYSFCVRFPETCHVDVDSCDVRLSDQNAVVLFVKQDDSLGDWDRCSVGLDQDHFQEKAFVTAPNLSRTLDAIDRSATKMPDAAQSIALRAEQPDVEVTAMGMEKLEITIKGCPEVDEDEEVRSPTVVHTKEPPKLHSILKQRTVSESSSSEDTHSRSAASEEDEDDEDEETEGGRRRRKKSVSFNDYVDQQTYKANMSVTTMKASLRSKKRRARKREERIQRKAERQERRRQRRASENSSDDSPPTPTEESKPASVTPERTSDPSADEPGEAGEKQASLIEEVKDGDAPKTMLSWEEGERSAEHKAPCGVDFANSVVFDLDVD